MAEQEQNGSAESGRLAWIVPQTGDENRGDQALVWEAASFALASNMFDRVAIVGGEGAAESLMPQTQAQGYLVRPAMLPSPRRGRHRRDDMVRETRATLVGLVWHAGWDWLWSAALLLTAPYRRLSNLLVGPEKRQTLEMFRQCRAVFVKGGGFLHSHGSMRDAYYTWYQLFYLRLAHRLGKPVYILPNSFGPFKGRMVRGQLRRVLSKCRMIAARESVSAKMLEELIGKEIPVSADMGYYLEPADRAVGEEACRAAGIPAGTARLVGITLRPWRFPGLSDAERRFDEYIESMAVLVRHVAERGFYPVLVAHTLGPNAHENDNLAIDEVCRRLNGVQYSRLDHPGCCRDLKSIYAQMEFLIGTRFHSVIFAQGAGVPAMAIAYGGNKGEGIMQDLGLGEFQIPIEAVSAEKLCERFDRLVDSADQVRRKLSEFRELAARQRQQMLEQIRVDLTTFENGHK